MINLHKYRYNNHSLSGEDGVIEKILEGNETTLKSIKKENARKDRTKTFDSDLAEAGEVLESKPEEDIEAIENESEVIKFSTAVVAEAIKMGVSDNHIEPYRFSSRVRYRLDGILASQDKFAKFLHDNYGAVVTRFKIMGKLDIAERRLPQDGAIPFKIDGKVVERPQHMLMRVAIGIHMDDLDSVLETYNLLSEKSISYF